MSNTSATLNGLSDALVALVEQVKPSLVAVKSAAYRTVSGILLGDGLIAVAEHMLRRQDRVPVHSASGSKEQADILGRDPTVDIAILKADGLDAKPLPAVTGDTLKPGMLAAVVGLTTDVGPSVSLGMIGAVGPSRSTWRGGTLDSFIRLDVNLYPSQSGAAVVSADGSLIGLATPALLRHSGVAVPTETIRRVADEIVKQGRIRQGYIGVGLQPVSIPASFGEYTGQAPEAGLIVLNVETGSPADEAKIQLGDILISIDGKPVQDVDELQSILRGDNVGRAVKAELIRGGHRHQAVIVVSERRRKEQ